MPNRPWLRHPPATLHPTACPTALPRFASLALARDALLPVAVSVAGLSAVGCGLCGGAHIVPVGADGPSVPP